MADSRQAHCCIVGGGPAGMVLGVVLARAGLDVIVLEKHSDFLRDFRGDTIHPSTLQVIKELGWLEEFLALPHQKVSEIGADYADQFLPVADFSKLPVACPYIALMPQWDFLNFLAEKGHRYPGFELHMQTEAISLIREGDNIVGVRARTPNGDQTFHADLVIAADGRGSLLRESAGLNVRDLGAPIDVLWFRVPRHTSDPSQTMAKFDPPHMAVLLDRGDYWQCAYIIAKGSFDELKSKGLHEFHASLRELLPFAADRIDGLADWNDVKLLNVRLDRLETWWTKGLLCIGDAAHAMSPIGDVGINLAVQDAVATANILFDRLSRRNVHSENLAAVQKRRMWPTRVTQTLQAAAHNRLLTPLLAGELSEYPPLPLRLISSTPLLRRLAGRLIGLGVRPEHISAEVLKPRGALA
ncbi:FAD-dependent oxidoreductase [Filomicrobium sp.]|uniref:FAD-dependent oxidoreductase n=1 Tax=Filomicrobium sp. TaxID=2024831 RepID=UPI00258AB230|nr:FAD-dependent oxidoreductase [Filomicrobium sp.]MCV0371545.1 FAD-dependent oxidoreductase [Filomicrobium sp.]